MFCEELEEACRDQEPASIPILALVYCKPTLIRAQEILARFAKKLSCYKNRVVDKARL